MEPVRLRVVFEDPHLLTDTQKSEGLTQSCILLKSDIETVSDLASHLTHSFRIHQTCPNDDLRITMDGFVLPPFESVRVFNDKDIIRVKRNKCAASDVIAVGDEFKVVENSEVLKRQPVITGVKLLALEEFEKENGGYQSEPEEIEYESPENTLHMETPPSGKISKKRKSSKKLLSTKRKRMKSTCSENSPKVPSEAVENAAPIEEQSIHQKKIHSQKSLQKNRSSKSSKLKKATKAKVANMHEDKVEHKHTKERCDNLEGNLEKSCDVPDGTKKGPSRSARRKKAKRKWLRELKNSKKEELIQSLPNKVASDKSEEHKEDEEISDPELEIVPIVVKPGHIRFEPLDQDQSTQQNYSSMENFKWNGTTSKRKGQKWGMEKVPPSWSDDYENFGKDSSRAENFQWNDTTGKSRKTSIVENTSRSKIIGSSAWDDSMDHLVVQETGPVNGTIDFEKLNPLSHTPKEGDVIAYRLVELSSTWCPELSDFRVGKVSWFESASNKIMLLPVPGFSVVSDEKREEEENALESDTSLYYEDGSLEIDFASLLDVRIINNGDSNPESVSAACTKEAPPINKEAHLNNNKAVDKSEEAPIRTSRSKEIPASNTEAPFSSDEAVDKNGVGTTGNCGPVDPWGDLINVLGEKKMQLSKEKEDWSTENKQSAKSRGSFKSLRNSALGPTVTRLRAANGF